MKKAENNKKNKTNLKLTYASHQIVGTRDYQEDAADRFIVEDKGLVVLCDGMGGLNGGEIASNTAVTSLLRAYKDNIKDITDYPEFFFQIAEAIDKEVFELSDASGNRLKCGTTLVSVAVEGDKLYWLSVGDSRIYIIRDNKITIINEEHNYETRLRQMLYAGQITQEDYDNEVRRGAALTSFVGIGDLFLMDISDKPFRLCDGDVIILSSDGLYRRVTDDMIVEILKENSGDYDEAAKALTQKAMALATGSQDNTTVAILSVRSR